MKKIISIALFAFATSFCFTSCTDEEITPKSDVTSSKGREIDPW